MNRYNPKEIEPKWQTTWQADKIHEASEDSLKPKKYVLEYFPYPSGAAMHVGHVRNYVIGDAVARFDRMNGYDVLHPMGWDAFGLPAENFAIKNQVSPRVAIEQNTKRFREQLMQMGFGYDWSREINSTDPQYYKWTQWFFLLLFKKGLAYQQESPQWWCPHDKTVLANEQVEAGKCWRCGHVVEKKLLKQWFFKITDYADRLAQDLDNVDWSDSIKHMQRNWIGRSKGAEIEFKVDNLPKTIIPVFTTRPDTLFGATFLVLAPEHSLVETITTAEQKQAVGDYITSAQAKSEVERQETDREKTGVFTGSYAINPANDQPVPIWIADYVLTGYGTGAIMAVPAHDERDHEFAKKFGLPITRVVMNAAADDECSHAEGTMMGSGTYDGMTSSEARDKIVEDLSAKGFAKEKINYKMRDWLISRQRYWGAPIPIIHCPKDGAVAVPDEDLPVKLPELTKFEPSGDGRSPLANVPEFVHTTCPKCGGPAERETDTMDGFACSSWYFLRFADPHNDTKPFTADKAARWLPVDDYIGGAEHAVMHLLYARFWTKVMFDDGLIKFDEPFSKLRNHGMILAPDGSKMSKSKGNTIEPGVLIDQGYGADAVRIMELFIAPWNQAAAWSVEGMGGSYRFLNRVWTLTQEFIEAHPTGSTTTGGIKNKTDYSAQLLKVTHKTIKKVTEDFQGLSFNTAIAAQMEAVNELYKIKAQDKYVTAEWKFTLESLLQLLAPFAPHLSEELWQQLGNDGSIHISNWPVSKAEYLIEDSAEVALQVNGRLRDSMRIANGVSEETAIATAMASANVQAHLEGKQLVKTIYVAGKIINFVVK